MTQIGPLLSNMQAQWQRHEILANNLANLSTPGFKRDDLAFLPGAASEQDVAMTGADAAGAGMNGMRQWTDFSQGPLRDTGRTLDVALNGNGFFVVDTQNGPRYTRAGSFSVSPDGYLVTSGGLRVQGEQGPILVGSSRVRVTPRGEIYQDERRLGALRVADFPKPYGLLKEGNGLFAPADPNVTAQAAREFEVTGGALEASNVNPVEMMVNMIDIFRNYEAAQRALQAVDEASRQAITDIGKV